MSLDSHAVCVVQDVPSTVRTLFARCDPNRLTFEAALRSSVYTDGFTLSRRLVDPASSPPGALRDQSEASWPRHGPRRTRRASTPHAIRKARGFKSVPRDAVEPRNVPRRARHRTYEMVPSKRVRDRERRARRPSAHLVQKRVCGPSFEFLAGSRAQQAAKDGLFARIPKHRTHRKVKQLAALARCGGRAAPSYHISPRPTRLPSVVDARRDDWLREGNGKPKRR